MRLTGSSFAEGSALGHRAFPTSWGACYVGREAVRFRIWAPAVADLKLRLESEQMPMLRTEDGWFELTVDGVHPDQQYGYVLPDGQMVPDPAARSQAGSVHGPSRVVQPLLYGWENDSWRGRPWHEAVIYELHVGTFTAQGTFAAAMAHLPHLVETGVSAIEIMPVAQFPGERGWGYDGVLPYAPHRTYGTPHDMKAFIDAAHGLGLMVFLDVVYNHFGPDGNYLSAYAPDFFNPQRHTPWGAAIAYERQPVRQFFIENALYWLHEFYLDGLRFDAIDQIVDPQSKPEFLIELADRVRGEFPDRHIHLTTEDNRNVTHLHERDEDGEVVRFTAEWNDDLHNAAHVLATGESDGYYEDFADAPSRHLARALAEGFSYQGEPSALHRGRPRGETSTHLPPTAFVDFLQNHDQIGNRALGERLSTLCGTSMWRALHAVLLLSPHIPLMFMGEEWGETRPFLFFTDFSGELASAVREGRRSEFANFAAFNSGEKRDRIPDPNDVRTFSASRLDWSRRPKGSADDLAFTRKMIALRKAYIMPLLSHRGPVRGRVLGAADGMIAVEWTFQSRHLNLRANLGESRRETIPCHGGVIAAWPDGAGVDLGQATLPATSVVFTLADKDTV